MIVVVTIVAVMMIADTTIEVMITRVAMKIVAVAMMVHDLTHDLITNMTIVDTNKSEMTDDKNMFILVSMSVNRPDWFRLPLKNNRIDVRKIIDTILFLQERPPDVEHHQSVRFDCLCIIYRVWLCHLWVDNTMYRVIYDEE